MSDGLRRLEALVATDIPDPSLADGVRNRFMGWIEEKRLECITHMEAERDNERRQGTLIKIPTVYDRATQQCGLLANLESHHMPAIHGTTTYKVVGGNANGSSRSRNTKSRRHDLRLLARMRARHFVQEGYSLEDAEKYADDLVRPAGLAPLPAKTRSKTSQDTEVKRLSRQQVDEARRLIPVLFGPKPARKGKPSRTGREKVGSAFLASFVAFLFALMIENGGRWEGLQTVRLGDIIWKGQGAARRPILIALFEPGASNKLRIYWRTKTSGDLLLAMLKRHPDPTNLDALLFVNPYTGTGPSMSKTLNRIWAKLSRGDGLNLGWRLGPRGCRRYFVSTKSASGAGRAAIQLSIGQKVGSLSTAIYVCYDDDDLEVIGDSLGFTEGLDDRTCHKCEELVPPNADVCRTCGAWLNATLDPDEARINAFARVGLRLHHLEQVAP